MKKLSVCTAIIITGSILAYTQQYAPSPILSLISESYHLENRSDLLNLSCSIVYITIIISAILASQITTLIGLKRLYILYLCLISTGTMLCSIPSSYAFFLFSRLLYGFGYGLGIHFIGAAISSLYTGQSRYRMNTMNGVFPYAGSVVCYITMPLITNLFGAWRYSFLLLSFMSLTLLFLWVVFVPDNIFIENLAQTHSVDKKDNSVNPNDHNKADTSYIAVWSIRSIRLLSINYMGEMLCYSYVSAILPTLLMESGRLSRVQAGFASAIIFSCTGLIGVLTGGWVISHLGYRKLNLVLGALIKIVGLMIFLPFAILKSNLSLELISFCMCGFGGGIIMPSLFTVPMDLDISTAQVGMSFSLMSSCAYTCAFLSPFLGGLLTDRLSGHFSYMQSLLISLIIFSAANIVAFIAAIRMPDITMSKNRP